MKPSLQPGVTRNVRVDIDRERIDALRLGRDDTGECGGDEFATAAHVRFSADAAPATMAWRRVSLRSRVATTLYSLVRFWTRIAGAVVRGEESNDIGERPLGCLEVDEACREQDQDGD